MDFTWRTITNFCAYRFNILIKFWEGLEMMLVSNCGNIFIILDHFQWPIQACDSRVISICIPLTARIPRRRYEIITIWKRTLSIFHYFLSNISLLFIYHFPSAFPIFTWSQIYIRFGGLFFQFIIIDKRTSFPLQNCAHLFDMVSRTQEQFINNLKVNSVDSRFGLLEKWPFLEAKRC